MKIYERVYLVEWSFYSRICLRHAIQKFEILKFRKSTERFFPVFRWLAVYLKYQMETITDENPYGFGSLFFNQITDFCLENIKGKLVVDYRIGWYLFNLRSAFPKQIRLF